MNVRSRGTVISFGLFCLSFGFALSSTAADRVVVVPLSSSKPIYTLDEGNLFVGSEAGNRTMTGDWNTAVGYRALTSNHLGQHNTAMGFNALYSNGAGSDNHAIGSFALSHNTDGNYNEAIGTLALSSNETGSSNIAIGYGTIQSSVVGSGNLAIGAFALGTGTDLNNNVALGDSAGYSMNGYNNTLIGYATDAGTVNNATAIGSNAVATVSNSVRLGNDAVTWIGGYPAWSNTSDRREKKDIQDISRGLEFIKALRPVEFKMNKGNDRVDFGFLAQDIQALLGEKYNILSIAADEKRTLSLRYTDFIAPMVKALQEQQGQIQQQQEIISAMRSELDTLKAEISSLKEKK